MIEPEELEAVLESILFISGEPVSVLQLCSGLEIEQEELQSAARRLMDRCQYERRGIRLIQMEDSYQLCSAPEFAPYIRKTLENRKPPRLSQPALEVLSIVAYFQPVTRAYVEQVRGVDSANTINLLLERGLIEEAGRLSGPGRPAVFRTNETFLRTFGLSSLEELPELPDLSQESEAMTQKLETRLEALSQPTEEVTEDCV